MDYKLYGQVTGGICEPQASAPVDPDEVRKLSERVVNKVADEIYRAIGELILSINPDTEVFLRGEINRQIDELLKML